MMIDYFFDLPNPLLSEFAAAFAPSQVFFDWIDFDDLNWLFLTVFPEAFRIVGID